MFFVTCALAARTRAIENILFASRETMKTGANLGAHFPAPRPEGGCRTHMSDSDASDTNIPLYRFGLAFGKFSEFCGLCATVA